MNENFYLLYQLTKGIAAIKPLKPPQLVKPEGTQFSSVAQSCPTLCNPTDCSTPGFPVLDQLLELAQTHVHWVGDAIQPSHPLSSPSPPAFNLSPASGSFPVSQFFPSGGQSIGAPASASVLPVNIQDWFLLGLTGLGWKQMGCWLPTRSYWIQQCTLGIQNREKQNTGLIKLRCVAKQWIQWAQILATSHI